MKVGDLVRHTYSNHLGLYIGESRQLWPGPNNHAEVWYHGDEFISCTHITLLEVVDEEG